MMFRVGFAALVLAACARTDDDDASVDGAPADPPVAGDDDDDLPGDTPEDEPGIVSLSVDEVFPGRHVGVRIEGVGTAWTDGTPVAFDGTGITANATVAEGPTTLVLTLTVANDAPLGPQDLRVGDRVLEDALTIVPSVEVTLSRGTPAQGSMVVLHLRNLDDIPFDFPTRQGNLAVDFAAPDGFDLVGEYGFEHTNRETGIYLYIDVSAPAGPLDLQLWGSSGEVWRLPTLGIAARAPIVVADGAAAAGSIAGPAESALFVTGDAEPAIFQFEAVATSGVDNPYVQLLGPDGAFGPLRPGVYPFLAYGERCGTAGPGPIHGIVSDFSGTGAMDVTVTTRSAWLGTATTTETENDTPETAQVVELPITVTDAEIEQVPGGFGDDWYEVVVGDADAGRSLGLVTMGPMSSDPKIEVRTGDGTLIATEDALNPGLYAQEVLFTDALAAGIYRVRVTADDPFLPRQFYTLAMALD